MSAPLFLAPPRRRWNGLALIEFATAVSVLAIVGSFANASYLGWRDRQGTLQATADIAAMGARLQAISSQGGPLPASLDLLFPKAVDPWGHAYRYRPLERLEERAAARVDRAPAPINQRFDLYSAGPDGESERSLADRSSADDVIWGRDGSYVGPARDF